MMHHARFLVAIGACAAFIVACDDGGTAKDVTSETADVTEDFTGRSVYRMTITQGDEVVPLDRDLTDDANAFAFGSTHIAPAVSFVMTDSVIFPRTITVSINLGIIVGSETYPVQTGAARKYPFGATPPAIDVFYRGLQYSSTQPGASGSINVTAWGIQPGDAMAGTFSGTLVAEGPSGRTLDVSGDFHFTLPERQ